MVMDSPLHYFRYKNEVAGYGADSPLAKNRIGFIADEVNPAFMWDNTIDQVSVNGILMASIKAQQGQIDSLKLQLNNEGLLNATSTADIASAAFAGGSGEPMQDGGIMAWVTKVLQSLGMALKDGVATLQGIVAKNITTDQMTAKQICVKDSGNNDICLTGDQLKDLINRAGSSVTIQSSVPAPQPQPNAPAASSSNSDASSTAQTDGDNASTTEAVSQ
jgi:hypothetical protein